MRLESSTYTYVLQPRKTSQYFEARLVLKIQNKLQQPKVRAFCQVYKTFRDGLSRVMGTLEGLHDRDGGQFSSAFGSNLFLEREKIGHVIEAERVD